MVAANGHVINGELQMPQCIRCGYSLVRLPNHQCPECGRPFDPTNPTTFQSIARRRIQKQKRLVQRAVIAIPLVAGGILLAIEPQLICCEVFLLLPYVLGLSIGSVVSRPFFRFCRTAAVVLLVPLPFFMSITGGIDISRGYPHEPYKTLEFVTVLALPLGILALGVSLGYLARSLKEQELLAEWASTNSFLKNTN